MGRPLRPRRLRGQATERELETVRATRPPDPRAIRRRRESLEVELDNQELARRRAAIDADLAAALAPPPPAAEPARPAPANPILVIPVRRVITSTPDAVCVDAWGLAVWLPKSVIHHHDPDALLAGWSGHLEVSSRWAAKVNLPPQSAPRRAGRSCT